jgi:26S proteasome regulatory subunit N9
VFHDGVSSATFSSVVQLYDNFINGFSSKLNQLQLIRVLVAISKQHYPSRPYSEAELGRAIDFLAGFRAQHEQIGDEAFVLATMEVSSLHIKAGRAVEAKDLMEIGSATASKCVDAPPIVQASVYRVAAELYKVTGPAEQFFVNAMQFLVHTDASSLPPVVAAAWATDLALAALVGKNVFNFGEIVEHPILASLEGTPDAWLAELLAAFQTGDIDAFTGIAAEHSEAFQGNAALRAGETVLKEKLTLLCVMELVSNTPPAERSLSFQAVADATRLGLGEVEWMLMRAMSLGLLKGSIDQVTQRVRITYVKPRVLHSGQVTGLREKFDEWGRRVQGTLVAVEDATGELFV